VQAGTPKPLPGTNPRPKANSHPKANPRPGAQRPPGAQQPLMSWAGTYWNLDTGASWTVSLRDSKLWVGRIELKTLGTNRFALGAYPIELIFSPATAGTPRKLTWLDVEPEIFDAVPPIKLTKAQEQAYVGTYWSDELNANYSLHLQDGKLAADGWRDDYGPLQPVIADGFSLRPPSLATAFIRFRRNRAKTVIGFTLSTEGCKNIYFARSANSDRR